MKKNKKGYIQDFVLFGIVILILAISLVIVNMFLGSVNDKIQSSDMSSIAKDISSDNSSRFSVIWDNNFMFIFFIFALAIIVGFYFIDTNPALFFPLVAVFAFIIFLFAIIGNVYDEFDDNTTIDSYSNDFSIMEWIMQHPVEIMVVIGFLGITTLFAKNFLT